MNIMIRDNKNGTYYVVIAFSWGHTYNNCESWQAVLDVLKTLSQNDL